MDKLQFLVLILILLLPLLCCFATAAYCSALDRRAEYRDDRVCLCVRLSVHDHILLRGFPGLFMVTS